ncbi:hypothetical protein [Synechococcus sp. MU1655]|uniref:hypothetical protein n=1 Tax=unclassified Synechococcus TaxID=2626047 RepID=UPI00202698FA|nr:hypothetical protein [Synechococcus sp. MU1655]
MSSREIHLSKFSSVCFCSFAVISLVFSFASLPGSTQRVPQVTGWTFSRSYGKGVGNSTATTAISESNGAESFSRVNVLPISELDPDGNFLIQDPDSPFSIGVRARKAEETVKVQQLNYFSLSDWGYTVFSY